METNDKIEHLLDMIEHPEKYSEEDMRKMLEDEECREYYELIVKADIAFNETSQEDAEMVLHEFEAKHIHTFSWRKIAAIFIGILMISGLTYAAISIKRHAAESTAMHKEQTENVVTKTVTENNAVEKSDTVEVKEKMFDDVELSTILNEMSAYYKLTIEYNSEKSKHLRLHFRWDKTQTAENVVETLNHFENVNITLADGKMSVE